MFYWIFRFIFILILNSLFKFKVEGLDNLPQKTNFIVVANHFSFLDTLAVGAAITKKTYWIASKDLYYGVSWLGWFFRLIDAFPSGSSSDRAVYLLTKNRNVGLFPEGNVSPDGKLGEFRRGAALLALKTGRPIVPCAIIGTFEALPKRAKLPRLFKPIKVKIGKPIYLLKEFDEMIDDVYMQEGMLKVWNSIQEMIDAG
jgi:1-acyl-sn-glycerol-3-phosphate acyltransferase